MLCSASALCRGACLRAHAGTAGTLGNLTSMKHLLLCCQRLSGTVSANLARSPKLETLDLSFNALTGSVPASIGTSLSLKEATLFSNNFSGSLPAFSGMLATSYACCCSLNKELLAGLRLSHRLYSLPGVCSVHGCASCIL